MRAGLTALAAALLTGCGQTGKLYLPQSPAETQGEVVTRPAQTPPEGSTGSGNTSSSPGSVGSPSAPDSPAPEVTAPTGSDPAGKKDKKNGAITPPPDPSANTPPSKN